MDNDVVEELRKIVLESLQSEEGNLNKAVDLAINFSTKNSISADRLLYLINSYELKGSYELVYIFAKTAANLSRGPKKADSYYNAGLASAHLNLVIDAEEQDKLALESYHKYVNTHLNYGNLLQKMGSLEGAEKQYRLVLEADPKNVSTHLNYGNILLEMRRFEQAEEQYKLALESDPNDADTHLNYGILLTLVGHLGESEKHFKIAIELDPNSPNSHAAYGLFLFSKNLEKEAINETEIASRLLRENGDKVKEHLSLAWIYEEFVNKYYNLKDYKKSGEYADKSGDEYIEAGKQAGESFKNTSLTKGYTLKGRAKIRTLEIKTPFYKDTVKRIWNKELYEIEKFTKIIDCIMDASRYYEKAAEASPKDNQLCSACSISMSCLSEMLDYMLAVIKQEKTPELEDKLRNWNEKLTIAKPAYKEHSKGELFINSLYKLRECIQNLDKYKKRGTRDYGRAFEECRKELIQIASNIEGPLQEIIENATKKMDVCRLKQLRYAGTETGYIPQPSKISQFFRWTCKFSIKYSKEIITSIIVTLISGVIIKIFFTG